MNTVRFAKIEDVLSIAKVYNKYVGYNKLYNCNVEKTNNSYWENKINDDKNKIFVPEQNNNVIAFIGIYPFTIRPMYKGLYEISLYSSAKLSLIQLYNLYNNVFMYDEIKKLCIIGFDENTTTKLSERAGYKTAMKLDGYVKKQHTDFYGLKRQSDRQYFCRKIMEKPKI